MTLGGIFSAVSAPIAVTLLLRLDFVRVLKLQDSQDSPGPISFKDEDVGKGLPKGGSVVIDSMSISVVVARWWW